MKTDWPTSLTDAELDQLDRFLRAHARDDDLLLDGVHGLLSALAVGPKPALPDEWLALVLHDPFNDAGEGSEVLSLLAKLNDSILAELGVDAYEPILGEVDEMEGHILSAAGWCEGFSRGIDMRAALWENRLASDEALMGLLGPIMALALDEGVLVSETEFEKLSEEEYDACLVQVPQVLAQVAQYWRENEPSEDEFAAAEAAREQAEAALKADGPPRFRGSHSLH
ncbi:YecA family protein [Oleiagrimonas sp. C23AA]|uniref:YecA/YgfB family protein n=1 Tax=Oleiagrimonas sp. C23AA TaxID=2719047 RepID=UPI001420F5A6|nr:YecA family protein [Oleiagrimonas sp. C23AA]NII10726.1 YecA family protein [Oleiagrimonas sp. C23AA]